MTRAEQIQKLVKDMKEYWGILCSSFNIHPEFDVMSTARATSVRAADLFNSGLMTEIESLETAILAAQQSAENGFVATTTHIIKGGDKLEYNSRVIFNIEILNLMMFMDDIPTVLEYLKLMMHHEFGHCIVYANLAKQCKTTNQFVELLDKRSVVYDSEYKTFTEYAKDKSLKDMLTYYHNHISEEMEANTVMKVNINRLVELDIKLKKMMDTSTQQDIPSIKHVVIKKSSIESA